MTVPKGPTGLGTRGRRLWRDLHELQDFDPAMTVLIEEACRIADRLDRLDAILRGEDRSYVEVIRDMDGEPVRLAVDSVLSEARQQENVLKQLLVALRLPDEATGKRPQRRGARGAYAGKSGSAAVSSLERARQRANGA